LERRLLGHDADARSMRRKRSRHGEHERSRTGNDDAFSADRHSGLHQRLAAAAAEYIRQRPAGKREEEPRAPVARTTAPASIEMTSPCASATTRKRSSTGSMSTTLVEL
jgi:hypothetical protein